MAVMTNNNDPAGMKQYLDATHRLQLADILSAQKDMADLAVLYEKEPALRFPISTLLYTVGTQRIDSADAFKPLLPALIAHLSDPDAKAREGAIRAIAVLKPEPPFEALDPLIKLSHTETEHENVYVVIAAVARFCQSSKAAVLALRDAAAQDQPNQKRAAALAAIGNSPSRDAELVDALAEGLKSDELNVVRAAVEAAQRFGPAAGPLRSQLERIAARPAAAGSDCQIMFQPEPRSRPPICEGDLVIEEARETLRQLQR
jgi:hypothetical protein